MKGLVTDHVISGPMRGLKKTCIRCRKQTDRTMDGHSDSMTESAEWGQFSAYVFLYHRLNRSRRPTS